MPIKFNSLLYKTNRFHVDVRLFSNRSQKTSKCGKNISDKLGYRLVCHFFVLTTFCFDIADNKSTIWVREGFSNFKAEGVIKQNGNPALAASLSTKIVLYPHSAAHIRNLYFQNHELHAACKLSVFAFYAN